MQVGVDWRNDSRHPPTRTMFWRGISSSNLASPAPCLNPATFATVSIPTIAKLTFPHLRHINGGTRVAKRRTTHRLGQLLQSGFHRLAEARCSSARTAAGREQHHDPPPLETLIRHLKFLNKWVSAELIRSVSEGYTVGHRILWGHLLSMCSSWSHLLRKE